MDNYTVNFTPQETSTNSTTLSFWFLVNKLDLFLYTINLLFGLPAHFYVIWLILKGTGSGVASEFFNLNLSVCEIGNSLNCLCYVLYSTAWFSYLKPFTYWLLGLSITGRPLFHSLICVECYLAVIHPVTFLKFKPLRCRVICCTVAWIITVGSCLCCIFTSSLFYISVCFYSIQFILFLSIQLFCLVAVLRALKQSGPGERRREREEENRMKKRAFYLIIITTVSMVIIYVPFTISGFSVILTQHYIKELFSLGFTSSILAGFVQPVLYLRKTGKLHLCTPSIMQSQ